MVCFTRDRSHPFRYSRPARRCAMTSHRRSSSSLGAMFFHLLCLSLVSSLTGFHVLAQSFNYEGEGPGHLDGDMRYPAPHHQQSQGGLGLVVPGQQYTFTPRRSSVNWADGLVLDPKHSATDSTTCDGDHGLQSRLVFARDFQYSMVSGTCLDRAVRCMKEQRVWCLDEGNRSGRMRRFCMRRNLNPNQEECKTEFALTYCTAEQISAYPCPTSCVYDEYRFAVSCARRSGTLCQRKTFNGPNSLTFQSVCVRHSRCSAASMALALATFFGRERQLRVRPDTPQLMLALEDERVLCSAAGLDYTGQLMNVGEAASATKSTRLNTASGGNLAPPLPSHIEPDLVQPDTPRDRPPPPNQGGQLRPGPGPESPRNQDRKEGSAVAAEQTDPNLEKYDGDQVVVFHTISAVSEEASSANSVPGRSNLQTLCPLLATFVLLILVR